MEAADERPAAPALTAAPALAAAALVFAAFFFSGGATSSPLLWIGGAAIVVAALTAAAGAFGVVASPRLDVAGAGFFACLVALTLWCGLTIVWSTEPDSSWRFTNRMLVYLAFALVGAFAAAQLARPGRSLLDGLALLLALLFGWAFLAKAVPGLYSDYGRVARLRAPIGYWNALALLGVVGVSVGVGVAVERGRRAWTRAGGTLLVYAATLAVLLAYSRANVALLVLLAFAWLALERRRPEILATLALGALPAIGVFGVCLALPGITNDGESRAVRAHDGWIFALVVVAVGAAVAAAASLLVRLEERRPLAPGVRERVDRAIRILLVAAVVAVVVLVAVFAGRVWHDFRAANEVSQGQGRFKTLASGNRWGWWQQAWHVFTRHPGGGTGAGTFDLTNRLHKTNPFDVAVEPHNVPLQFLSETGVPGLLLFLAVVGFASLAVVRARRRGGEVAVTAVGLALAVWALHLVVDIDWSYAAVTAPLLLAAGALTVAGGERRRAPSPARLLPAAAAVVVAAAAVYSLTLPWLAQRQLDAYANALTRGDVVAAFAHAKRAHGYDPLSVDALTSMAVVAPTDAQAFDLYRRALKLEPLNPDTWYALGDFEWHVAGDAKGAYLALDRSWGLDRRDGPLSVRCSLLDYARRAALGYGISCPPLGQAERPGARKGAARRSARRP